MRPIKFRAWHKYIKEMLIPEQCLFNENGTISSFAVKTKGDDGQYIVKNEDDGLGIELMQFTGILDKNGKGIYEGDIVMWIFQYMPYKSAVSFDEGFFSIEPSNDGEKYALINYIPSGIEVIGNIYENPDLLPN